MEYKNLGKSGLKVSVLSLGAWVTYGNQVKDEEIAYECMKAAVDAGVNFFDNAEVYGGGNAETVMGKVIKKAGWKRSDLVITTKIYWGGKGPNDQGLSRKHIIEGTKAALERLQMDYVDVLYCHRPDTEVPMEETVRAMNYVIEKGWAFYWGTSEWSAEEIMHACGVAERLGLIAPVVEQPQYSMLHRTRFEHEYARLYSEIGLGTTIWSPLACGLLTGKYTKDKFPADSRLASDIDNVAWLKKQLLDGKGMNMLETKSFDRILEIVDDLKPIAKRLDCSLAQLALAWCLKNPNVTTVITGASKASQVTENMHALAVSKKITPEIMEEIEKVLRNKPTPTMRYKSN